MSRSNASIALAVLLLTGVIGSVGSLSRCTGLGAALADSPAAAKPSDVEPLPAEAARIYAAVKKQHPGEFKWQLTAALLAEPSAAAPPDPAAPRGYELVPVSGEDGGFKTVHQGGVELRRGNKEKNDSYALYMYFQVPKGVLRTRHPVYVEVVYRDGGHGLLDLQYNAASAENYRRAEFGYGRLMTSRGKIRTAVFELTVPDFRQAQNLQGDLRLVNPHPQTPLQIISATLYVQPTPLFLSGRPYQGPALATVDAKTLRKKVLCGYQGWFRAPGDGQKSGWVHWSKDNAARQDGVK